MAVFFIVASRPKRTARLDYDGYTYVDGECRSIHLNWLLWLGCGQGRWASGFTKLARALQRPRPLASTLNDPREANAWRRLLVYYIPTKKKRENMGRIMSFFFLTARTRSYPLSWLDSFFLSSYATTIPPISLLFTVGALSRKRIPGCVFFSRRSAKRPCNRLIGRTQRVISLFHVSTQTV